MLESLTESSAEKLSKRTLKLGCYCTAIVSGPIIFTSVVEILAPSIYNGNMTELLDIIPKLTIFGFLSGGSIALLTQGIESGISFTRQKILFSNTEDKSSISIQPDQL